MKKILPLLVCWVAISLDAVTLDGIAAKVESDTITIGDVMNEIRRRPNARASFSAARGNESEMQALWREALDALVDRKLILKAAADKKVEIQEWMVDNRVREVIQDAFGGDRAKLESALEESRTTFAEWRTMLREDMVVAGMRFQMIEKDLAPSPVELRAEYTNHPARYAQTASSTVRVILLKPDAKVAVSTRGEEILGRLEKGEDFGALAREYSADSHASEGGLWQDIKPGEAFRAEIADAIAKINCGEHSQLVDLDGWGFIVRKESEKHEKKLSFAEAYDSIMHNIKQDTAKARYDAWVRRLRAEAYVKTYPMPGEN